MMNASLILIFLVVLLITKLNASTYEPSLVLIQEDAFPNSSTEVERNLEPIEEMVLKDVSLHSQKVNLDTKPRKESSDYKNPLVDYDGELLHILGPQYEEVEDLLNQDVTEDFKKDQSEMNKPDDISLKKSKLYVVHPYQMKSKMTPTSMDGPIMYLGTEEEDESSPLRYYQQYGRKSSPQYTYVPKKKDQLLNLFPGLASESKSNNQPLRTKTKFDHGTVKESSSKIALERMQMGWPFGYDLTKKPSEYSIMHNVDLNLHPNLALMKQKDA